MFQNGIFVQVLFQSIMSVAAQDLPNADVRGSPSISRARAQPVAGLTIVVPGEGREKPAIQAGFFFRPGASPASDKTG
tara:strand:- start:1079 stop:1312 length:234 start_codon:yes stop_codon:yes gene_type:complete